VKGCTKLCSDLLEKIRLDQIREDAELARRPNAAQIGSSLQKSLAGALEREKELRERVKQLELAAAAKA
jgi:hypothetical protein